MTPMVLDALDARIGRYEQYASTIFRLALAFTILLAGMHKLVSPEAWYAYLAPLFFDLWPTAVAPLDPTFRLFGVSEVVFGVVLLSEWHTPTVATIVGLSLLGVVLNLFVAVGQGTPYVDVLVRDVGLTLLAFGVAVETSR